jgi:beta-galactosidase
VRWAALTNTEGTGLMIVSENAKNGLGISALHMPNEDFDLTNGLDYGGENAIEAEFQLEGATKVNPSKHINDIKEQDLVQLNIDMLQRGVAGDNSWGARPQQEYQIRGDKIQEYGFYLIPFASGKTSDLVQKAKVIISQKISKNE